MADNIQRGEDGLPITTDKELAAMDKLFSSGRYQLKEPGGFLRSAKKEIIKPDFIMRTLDEFVRHLHALITSVRKMIPAGTKDTLLGAMRTRNAAAAGIINMALSMEIKELNDMLNILQASPRRVTVAALQPFVKALYKPLIRIYYLEPEYASSCIMDAYHLVAERLPSSEEAARSGAASAAQEIKYIYEKIFPQTYPLVLRMTSSVMLSERDLFYKNGSKVLDWLDIHPDEIIFPGEEGAVYVPDAPDVAEAEDEEEAVQVPESVSEGLEMLEKLFPQAGWEKMLKFPEEKSDFGPYFVKTLQLPETFIQLSPDHPFHFTMILFFILSELFQGLRHVDFNSTSNDDNIYKILDDWIMYGVSVFDKTFGDDIKSYTHQIYSQADFARSNYASRLVNSMYSLIRQYFLPYYDMRLYSFHKTLVDRLPALYPRVMRLREMLDTSIMPHTAEEADFAEAVNASSLYRFDIPNVASKHLDALCGGSRSRRRTNETLIRCCSSILAVLDWWINDIESPAYRAHSPLIYRTAEEGSSMPSFGVEARKDTEEIFRNSLKKEDTPS